MALHPLDLLTRANTSLKASQGREETRMDAYEGRHELPYAPPGVNSEYEALRAMAPVPLIRLAVRTPCQRLRVDGIRTGATEDRDKATWDVWQANHLDARQRIVYVNALVYKKGGIVSVWPNPADPAHPVITVEDPTRVHIEPDPSNPFKALWSVKTWAETRVDERGRDFVVNIATVFLDGFVYRYESGPNAFGTDAAGAWDLVDILDNPLGRDPFVRFAPELNANGGAVSMVDALMPMQRAIDTMRFNLLLAAQFAAFRQRFITGYDPVVKDADGNVVVQIDPETGDPRLDANGQQIPVVASPGRAGVDRIIAFPGTDTKVFDLEESNLANYVTALDMLLATFASTSQVPPQYLVGDFKNVSGDLMVATEATLLSLITDLQTSFGEAWEQVFDLASIARGDAELPLGKEVVWADASPKDIAVIGSAMAQMVPNGAPARMFLEMLPGATQQKVERWMSLSGDALSRALGGDLAALTGPKAGDASGLDAAQSPSAV